MLTYLHVVKLLCAVVEGNDLGGADECEVQGVEEEDHVLAAEIRQPDALHPTRNDLKNNLVFA